MFAFFLCLAAANTAENTEWTLNDLRIRDPFILPVASEKTYYLFGTRRPTPNGPGFTVFTSKDLVKWQGPRVAFTPPEEFVSENYWAPEVYAYKGKYYLFGTFKPKDSVRGTYTLIADRPEGPYRFHSDGPVTPADWYCLDGTLFIDDQNAPWMVFCHEWVQVGDGEICAMRLNEDLSKRIGDPILLFKASEAPWVRETGTNPRGRITDGPFFHRTADGALLMIWSSFGEGGYKLAVARSESGKLEGPWKQEAKPIFENDGGHGMLFRTFDGTLMLTLHQPNRHPDERARLFTVKDENNTLSLTP